MEKSIRMTGDRDKWRKYVHGVANPRIEHGYRTEVKVKFFPYSLPSVGPGADPGVQAVSPQVT